MLACIAYVHLQFIVGARNRKRKLHNVALGKHYENGTIISSEKISDGIRMRKDFSVWGLPEYECYGEGGRGD